MDKWPDPEKSKLLMAALKASPDIIVLSELESGRILEVNEAFAAVSGYSPEEAIGRSGRDLDLWVEPEGWKTFIGLAARDGRVRGFEARLRLKWGEVRLFQLSSAVAEQDGFSYLFTIARDISDRDASEERLRKAAFLLERAEEMAKIGSWEFDYVTKKVSCSAGAARIYGIEPEDLAVRTIEDVPLPEYRAALNEARDRHIAHGDPYDMQFKIRRKTDGAILDIHSRALWNAANKRLFGIIRDITDERRVEEGLREVIAQRDALINELNHRIANTLQLILSILKLEEGRGEEGKTRSLIERLSRRVESIALVHESLYEARNLSRIDLADYLPKLVETLRQFFGRFLTVEYALESAQVLVDAAVPCGIIVEELMENAFAHAYSGSRGGVIRVSASRDADGIITIAVADDGAGPSAPPGIEDGAHLGLLIVKTLGEDQLRGSVVFGGPPGFSCSVAFKDDFMAARV